MGSADLRLALPARYAPVRHLANGGMAAVWVARDTVLDREVAVKILAPELTADEDARARFTREALAAARLSAHPNVVTVYDAGEHDGQAYLVMALYPGGTVADRLRVAIPPTDVTLRWLRETADGLDAAHAAGIVHRDVKPGNLLLDERDRVAVGDFGIATAAWAASVTRTGLVVGTMAYLAPEQRSGAGATPASDRYALGVVAHELLTGRRPVDGGLAPDLPPAARRVLERATALDQDARYPSARAMVGDLERALGDEDDRTAVMSTAVAAAPAAAAAGAVAGAAAAGTDPGPAAAAAAAPAATAAEGPGRAGPARRGVPLLAAVGVLALTAGAGAALLAGDDEDGTGTASSGTTAERTTPRTTRTQATTQAAQTPATPTPTTQADSPAPAPVDDPRALNDAGFALFQDGRYAEALPLLERAVAGLEATPDDIYYAYALYNLGATLRRLGRPAEAVPFLQRRLEVSDFKRGVVQAELNAALRESGQAPAEEDDGKGGKPKKDKDD